MGPSAGNFMKDIEMPHIFQKKRPRGEIGEICRAEGKTVYNPGQQCSNNMRSIFTFVS